MELMGMAFGEIAPVSSVSLERAEDQVTRTRSDPEIWAIGGGKGGVGKSVLSVLLSYWLARTGKRTVIVDFDLGGANLHSLMGVRSPSKTLYDFVKKKYTVLEDICINTPLENLRLISGASEVLSLANPHFSQKVKLINHLSKMDTDYVLLDLGAGTSFNVLDFFLAAHKKIVVLTPEPTAIQNAYMFVRNAVYRMFSRFSRQNESFQTLIKTAMDPKNELNIRTVKEVLQYVEDIGGKEVSEPLQKELGLIRPAVITNMVKNDREKNASRIIQIASEKYLMIDSTDIGSVAYDKQLLRMIADMVPLIKVDQSCDALASVYGIVRNLLSHPDRAIEGEN
jgi:flagellar biosynthesis protein FlhG